VVKKPRAGQTSYNFHLENLQLPGEIEDTKDEHEAEPGTGTDPASNLYILYIYMHIHYNYKICS
jgi:hypothetical protein